MYGNKMGAFFSYFWVGKQEDSAALDKEDPTTGLTPRQVQFITDTWTLVKKDIRGNGVDLFMRLFRIRPELQKRFSSFADMPLEELAKSKRLQAHTNSVMYALDSVVDSLNDPECLNEMLLKIGENHGRRRITERDFMDLKVVFMQLLKDKLDIHLTPYGEEAWSKTVDVIYKGIFEGLKGKIS
ncbi:globin [Anabrus simplex]|uniref:globin n=1 Tax=Anabrus simplex TaxID=316456 RepID=UPI0034DCF576